ncbi:MAG: hypothetical protein HYY16_12600 [Planctomycetes bacterium]|nr:hypothetical protein [Planctomycetota bacterium]
MVRSTLGDPKTHYGASEDFSRVSAWELFPLAAGPHRVMGFDSPEFTSDPSVYRFTGKELDPDSIAFNVNNARYHFPARFYVPFRGAFGQVDPLAFAIPAYPRDKYSYANSDPAATSDPLGLQAVPLGPEARPEGDVQGGRPPDLIISEEVGPVILLGEWITGAGPKKRVFREGSFYVGALKEHDRLKQLRANLMTTVRYECAYGSRRYWSERFWSTAGLRQFLSDVVKFAQLPRSNDRDQDLARRILGSFSGTVTVHIISCCPIRVRISIRITNVMGLESATRDPVTGTSVAGKKESGGFSDIEQVFTWDEELTDGSQPPAKGGGGGRAIPIGPDYP